MVSNFLREGVYFVGTGIYLGKPVESLNQYKSIAMTSHSACFSTEYEFEAASQICFTDTGAPAPQAPNAAVGKISRISLQDNFSCGITESRKIHCWGPGAAAIMNTIPAIFK